MPANRRRIALLGATGSIGRSARDVIASREDAFELVAATAHRDVQGLVETARAHRPGVVVIGDETLEGQLRSALGGLDVEVRAGAAAIAEAAARPDVDRVVNGVVGAAGLAPTLAALEAGIDVALANKESLVLGGALVTETAGRSGARLIPIDSEHCSLAQCLEGCAAEEIRHVVLTASGGPFRERSLEEIDALDPAEALRHPTWAMGERITVDSATLMNKGLEIIEAHWLFGLPPDRIQVIVHPESIVHAIAVKADGSMLAHMAAPDMRLPIEWAISHPEPPSQRFEPLDLAAVSRLRFEAPDRSRFRCLALAERALRLGGTAPTALNAADEVCVAAYLARQIRFREIAEVVEATLDAHEVMAADRLEVIEAADRWARAAAEATIDARITRRGST